MCQWTPKAICKAFVPPRLNDEYLFFFCLAFYFPVLTHVSLANSYSPSISPVSVSTLGVKPMIQFLEDFLS